MKKKWIITLMMLLLFAASNGQDRIITGKVIAGGRPVGGVDVALKNTRQRTITSRMENIQSRFQQKMQY